MRKCGPRVISRPKKCLFGPGLALMELLRESNEVVTISAECALERTLRFPFPKAPFYAFFLSRPASRRWPSIRSTSLTPCEKRTSEPPPALIGSIWGQEQPGGGSRGSSCRVHACFPDSRSCSALESGQFNIGPYRHLNSILGPKNIYLVGLRFFFYWILSLNDHPSFQAFYTSYSYLAA